MTKTKSNKQNNLDPYEDLVRKEKLDAYEAQIKSNLCLKKIINLLNKIT
tara:strand:+ start:310 stop:456 length:147 start_codon:yes stop_codon:yes gene_type:complete